MLSVMLFVTPEIGALFLYQRICGGGTPAAMQVKATLVLTFVVVLTGVKTSFTAPETNTELGITWINVSCSCLTL